MLPLDPVSESPLGPATDRAVSAVVLVAAGIVVWFLFLVTPSPSGYGTHRLWGMPECGWIVRYQKPCPTCGMTTAAAHMVRLHVLRSIVTQPFGAALSAFGLWLAAVAAWCLARRRSYLDFLTRLPQARLLIWAVVLLLGSWAYTYSTFSP